MYYDLFILNKSGISRLCWPLNKKPIYFRIEYDSYMRPEDKLRQTPILTELRLLDVDKPLFVQNRRDIKILTTSTDVLHSWAVPALGVKMDAVPGRLNQLFFNIYKPSGIFYGQCSEICGVNHGFMPIKIMTIPLNPYLSYERDAIFHFEENRSFNTEGFPIGLDFNAIPPNYFKQYNITLIDHYFNEAINLFNNR
jgi:heme/copper-type cytochrome/quinol oxidase subunit 2